MVDEHIKILSLLEEARILKIILEGEKEYREQKLKPIRSLFELSKFELEKKGKT